MGLAALIGGIGVGAGLMYVLDPQAGGRRRALARDQLTRLRHNTDDVARVTARDVSNRAAGTLAAVRGKLRGEPPSDETIHARVRAKLGHYASHPRAIETSVQNGCVSLRGPVLASEAEPLRRVIHAVRGVLDVDDHLEVHESGEGIPALQGGTERGGERFELFQNRWSPTARLLVGLATGLVALGAVRQLRA